MKKVFNYKYIPAITISFLIIFLSLLPGKQVQQLNLDKELYHLNGHFLLYMGLAISLYYASKNYKYSIFLPICLGIVNEILQLFIPARSFQTIDLILNTLGVLLGVLIIWCINYITLMKRNNLHKI